METTILAVSLSANNPIKKLLIKLVPHPAGVAVPIVVEAVRDTRLGVEFPFQTLE